MLQTVMQLLRQSRTTSYSTSFQPFMLFSTSTCGELANAATQRRRSSSSFLAKPEPRPPRAKAARTMTGKPMLLLAASASSQLTADAEGAQRSPICSMARANSSRSSVVMIVSMGVPRILTPSFSSSSLMAMPTFSAVWPPNVT
jgi:hypothetical protein